MLTLKQLETQLQNVPETESEVKKAKSLYFPTMLFSGVGGFFVGYPIGTAIGGGDAQWGLAGLGGVGILIGMRFEKAMHQHYIKAIEIYNSKIINSDTN